MKTVTAITAAERKVLKAAGQVLPATQKSLAVQLRAAEEQPEGGDQAGRVLTFVASTSTVDREGDTIAVSGWKLGPFLANPVFLWMHDRYGLPLGRALKAELTAEALVLEIEFATAAANPQAEQVFQLYRGGFLRAVSVGFLPLKWQWVESTERPYGIDYLEQELLELSAVTVPANPEALIVGTPPAAGADDAERAAALAAANKKRRGAVSHALRAERFYELTRRF